MGHSARMQTLPYLAGLFQINCLKCFDRTRGSGLESECVCLHVESSHQGWLWMKNHDISIRDSFSPCNQALVILIVPLQSYQRRTILQSQKDDINSINLCLVCPPTFLHDRAPSSNVNRVRTKLESPWNLKAKLKASKVREDPGKSSKFVVWLFPHIEPLVSHSNGIIFSPRSPWKTGISSQHFNATYCNIVGRRPLLRRAATFWVFSNLSQQHSTCRNSSQHGVQMHAICCAQQCCDPLAGASPNDRSISTQHIATLLDATCCARLATLLRCVATFWVLLVQIWNLSNFSCNICWCCMML